ncbi:PAS domain S-box protein [Methanobacterium congolense]|uniref:histidine kinase n=1 Tax=Methanobacterium congolense TaxID=118062 RepID=A0A1D3KZR9_9EURY|nr:PAS domain S-box protein [Methanobacterium congolense]SCG84867.1 putative PAS/PAC sensor protein [Methanobacterium congolense]
MEMFNRSPIGILLYNKDGKLLDANHSALEITGNLEEDSDLDIFCSEFMAQNKEILAEEGSFRFQAPLNFENIKNKAFEKSGEILIDWNISVLDSGFLVQIQEVTEKTSEESIKENERYRRWFEEDLTGDFIATLDGRVLDCNPAFAEIYGFHNLEHAVEADISNFNRPDWETLIKRIKLERKVQGHQSTHRRPDGRNIHIVANVVGIFDDFGELVQVKGYVFDDTERKKAEESLKRSEEKYRRLFAEDLTGDFIATLDGKVLDCNPAFAEIYGFNSCEKALNSDISQFDHDDWVNLIFSLKDEGKIQDHQRWHRRPDGREIHVVSNLVGIFDDFGELVQVKGYVFDDTERKKAEESLKHSEEKYRRLFAEDLTGDFIATLDGKVLDCNPAFAEIYGFNSCEKALNSDISQFDHDDWVNLIFSLKDEGKIQDHQRWHRRPDGREIHVVSNLVGIFDDFGELVQVKGYVFDDTERKKAEESLKHSEEKYHRLFDEDLTGDFIATPKGEILDCNPAFAEIYGFDDCDRALQWNISESNSFDWPYMVTRLKRESKIKGFQSWQRRSDGLRVHVVANVVGIFDDFDELVQVKGYVFNDTERKQAEEKLANAQNQIKEILDSIKDGFVALNSYWNFIYVNQAAGEYFGAEPEDIIGENIWEIFPELLGTKYEKTLRRAMDEQETQYFEDSDINETDQCFGFSVYPSLEGISIYWRKNNLKI